MDLLGISLERELAELFGVTKSAVSQWPKNAPIPPARYLELRYVIRPDLFSAGAA